LEELAELCKNFTGAEIVGLINSATSFALNRHIKVGNTVEVAKDAATMRVTKDDFFRALSEVHAAYGVDEDEFASCGQDGVLMYSDEVQTLFSQAELVIRQAAKSEKSTLSGVLIYGATGSGKTAICAKLATGSNFPFIKLLSTHALVGLSEQAKVQAIAKVWKFPLLIRL
jgi:vesicle-fusing ATPase